MTTDVADLSVPKAIGRYDIVRELGRGTMGVVYEARDTTLGRTVALKTIDAAVATAVDRREEFEKRFFAEARIAARLSHPGIIVCHDVGKDEGTGILFIVLEYLSGQTLGDRVKAGAVPWYEAVRIVAKVARAIGHAHQNGVVHRDLKPANIMLLESGEPKIMDFGIAKVESARLKLTALGQSLGSPLYMSPEQALGNETDSRTDIFSLASVLCTTILGRPYFAADNIPNILARIIREDPPTLSMLVSGAPPSLDRVLGHAMAKSPADRYETAANMAEDLEDVLASRSPRHTDAGSPRAAEGTMVSVLERDSVLAEWTGSQTPVDAADADAADPLDELRTLVDDAVSARTRPPRTSARRPAGEGEWELRPPTHPHRRAPSPPRAASALPLASGLAVLVVVLLAVAIGVVFVRGVGTWRPVTRVAPAAASPPIPRSQPTRVESTAIRPATRAPVVTTSQAAHEPPSAVLQTPKAPKGKPLSESRLHLVVKHRLKSGRLRLFIDDELAYETSLRAKGSKKLFVTIREEAQIDRMLTVTPGKHNVRVTVTWDDNEQVETTSADFKAEATEELEAKLGGLAGTGLAKGLSLEWK